MDQQLQPPSEYTETTAETQEHEAAQTLQGAREVIARSVAMPTVPHTVVAALHSEQTEERVDAMLATLQFLSTLDKITNQKEEGSSVRLATDAPPNVDAMMTLLIEETRRARRLKVMRRLRITGEVMFIVFLLWITHWHIAHQWWFFYMFGGGAWAADKAWNKRHEAVSELGKAGDPRAVGVLAVAARDGQRVIQVAARNALLQLLPRVRADHAAAIAPDQMNALLELAFQSEPTMQIAVLKALEQIGDRRALPVVQNLSLSPDPVVRRQAKQCLPFLTERARRAEESATLLRGTSSPAQTAAPRELLRPVTQTADATPPDQLLRPTEQAEFRQD